MNQTRTTASPLKAPWPFPDRQGTVQGQAPGPAARPVPEWGAAEAIEATHERAYWTKTLNGRDDVQSGSSFDGFGPARGFGVDAHGRYPGPGHDFDDVESALSGTRAAGRGSASLIWERARHAVRDAWHRISPSR